jgi:pyrroloquinoline quinone biosynthesis protein D
MELNGHRTLRRSADVVCRQVGPESILVPVRSNVGNLDFVYTLSPVAARIWALLDGSRSLDQIVEALCEEYDVPRETATTDVAELVASLTEATLLAEVPR